MLFLMDLALLFGLESIKKCTLATQRVYVFVHYHEKIEGISPFLRVERDLIIEARFLLLHRSVSIILLMFIRMIIILSHGQSER